MKYKLLTVFSLLAFTFSVFGTGLVSTKRSRTNDLAKLLPESDGVITLDSNRLFNTALPQMLAANQPLLEKVNNKLDDIKSQTGLDLRKFNEVAAGIKTRETSTGEIAIEPLILARGDVESQAVVAVARLASNGKYKTEKIGKYTVYIFSVDEIVEKNKPKKAEDDKSVLDKALDKMFEGLSNELALTAYDEKTIALGSLSRVKGMIGGAPRVNVDVLSLLDRNPMALANMGALLPNGISRFIKLSDDELGETLDSIRQMQGSLDINDGTAVLSLMAKTSATDQAESLEGTLSGLRMLGQSVLGSSKNADKKVYARMVENAQITRDENSVMLDLSVPQGDIDILIGKN